jgi:hypothetical protein
VAADSVVFYVRSFVFTVEEFCHVLGLLMDASYDMNDKIFYWLELADSLKNDEEHTQWTVRYAGRTEKSPWSRHAQDMVASSKPKTWFGRFLKVTQQEYPHIIANVEFDIVTNATASTNLSSEVSNLREQLLILLFGIGVVNMQAGGLDVVTPFTEDDQNTFLYLKTNTRNLLRGLQPCPEDIQELVQDYLNRIRKYVAKHPISTGADRRPFSSDLVQCLQNQATPAILPIGCALITSIASDIGQDDHEDSTFYRSGRRSAEIVNSCFDHLEFWEKPYGSAFKSGATKTLSNAGHLPFVDVFPWFKKTDDDFPKAGELLQDYLGATKPLIVLTYGQLPSYLALESFTPLTAKGYYETQRTSNVELGSDYYIQLLGVPHLRHLGDSEDDVIVIPCYHPGYLSQAGLPSIKATTLFLYVHQIVWFSMGVALQQVQESSQTWTRKGLCGEIMLRLQEVLASDHQFGRAFASVKQETIDVTNAFVQGRVTRRKIRNEGQPKAKSTRSVSPKKAIRKERKRIRKNQITTSTTAVGTAVGGYEVYVRSMNLNDKVAPRNDRERHILSWKEPSLENNNQEAQWTIGPLVLPNGVLNGSDKRFIYYTGDGIDIRDTNGHSQGEIKPLHSGRSKTCTLPISAIIVHTAVDDVKDQEFLEHWEDVTGIDIDEYLRGEVATGMSSTDMLAGRCPVEFFLSSKKRSLPFPAVQHLHKATRTSYVTIIKKNCTPAEPGDMLWLLSQFLREICDPQKGAYFDMSSPSENPASVYRLLARFCHGPTYQHHPHLRTLLAIAHLADMGITERMLMSNVIATTLETLAAYTKKTKTISLKAGRKTSKIGYASYKIEGLDAFHQDIIAPFTMPPLESEVEIVEESEVTDDEAELGLELGKRKHDEHSDSDDAFDIMGRKPDKIARGQEVGEDGHHVAGQGSDDEPMLFDEV